MRTIVAVFIFIVGGCSDVSESTAIMCNEYCGSLQDMSARCVKAFGAEYDIARECAAESAPDCKSLTEFSPGLTSDCVEPGKDIFCCEE